MFFHVFQCFSASAQFARPSTGLELQKENWSIEFRTTRTWFTPGGGADVFSCGPNLDKRKQLYSDDQFLVYKQSKMLPTNQTPCPSDCWWFLFRITEPQVQQPRTLSFFKWLVPKHFSGNTNPRNSLDSNALSCVESKQLREGKNQY